MNIEFIVPGSTMCKQRPKFTRRGNFVKTYTPKKTMDYQKKVRIEYNKVARGKKLEGAVKADICAIYEPPKHVSKATRTKMINGEIPYTKKYDIDNILKSILDGLNQIAYDDDAQINEAHITKMYGSNAMCQIKLSDEKHVIQPIIDLKDFNYE